MLHCSSYTTGSHRIPRQVDVMMRTMQSMFRRVEASYFFDSTFICVLQINSELTAILFSGPTKPSGTNAQLAKLHYFILLFPKSITGLKKMYFTTSNLLRNRFFCFRTSPLSVRFLSMMACTVSGIRQLCVVCT